MLSEINFIWIEFFFVCYREKYSQAIYAVNNNQIDYILIPCTLKWSLTFLQTAYCSVTNATFTAQKSTRESFLGSIINTLCNQQILNYLYTYFERIRRCALLLILLKSKFRFFIPVLSWADYNLIVGT